MTNETPDTKTEEKKLSRKRGRTKTKKTGAINKLNKITKAPTDKKSSPADYISEGKVEHVSLKQIEIDDDTFKYRIALKVNDLVQNIKDHGQQLPVILRPHPEKNSKYQIISGFRRIEAIKTLKWDTVAAIVRRDIEDNFEGWKISVIENEARKSYSDIDRAYAIVKAKDGGQNYDEISKVLGLSKRQVERIKSLTTFPDEVQTAIGEGIISTTHALTLRSMANKFEELNKLDNMSYWITEIKEKKLSVPKLKKAIQQKYQHNDKIISLIRPNGEKPSKTLRLNPISVDPDNISEEQKKLFVKELYKVLRALGQEVPDVVGKTDAASENPVF